MDLPDEPQIRWILRTTAVLLHHGAEPVHGLVQPTAEFFPDRFDGSPKAVAALQVELAVISPEGQAQTVGCSSGACGGAALDTRKIERVAQLDDGRYRVAISAGEVRSPIVLTTAFARAVSFMFLSESATLDELLPRDREPAVDLAAVLLGFGVLVANGSYQYAKGCSGVQVHSATRMPVDELTLALAIYCRLHDVADRVAARHLDVTPRAHFDESTAWASSNMPLVRMLREAPARIAEGDFIIGEARSWLARVLGVGKSRSVRSTDDELVELERSLPHATSARPRVVDQDKAKKLAEIRALVDESLEG
jgi:hypothetical protein